MYAGSARRVYLPCTSPIPPLYLPYQVCSSISEVYDTHECYVLVVLDLPRIAELHLHVSARTARDAMLSAPKLKLRETDVHIEGEDRLKVRGLGLVRAARVAPRLAPAHRPRCDIIAPHVRMWVLFAFSVQ